MIRNIEFADGGKYNVIVIGAGTAGVFAAISAAKSGAKTLLIEKTALPGGTITSAGVDFPGLFHAWGKQIIDGPCYDAIRRAEKLGGAVIPKIEKQPKAHWHMQIKLNRFIYVSVCEEMLKEAGVTVYYHCSPVFVSLNEHNVEIGVVGKNQRILCTASAIIDATGDANIAEMAGYATEQSEVLQPATLINNIDGYDINTISPDVVDSSYKKAIIDEMISVGDFQYQYPYKAFVDGRVSMHISGVDASSLVGRTELEMSARKVLNRTLKFLRSLPGGENTYVCDFAPECGVRETKRIIGEGCMTLDNYLNGYCYPDAVAYCFYPIDLHEKVGVRQIFLKDGIIPTIPYSALVPKGSKRILVAGRCASGDTETNSAYRVQASCMAMGQVAGVAASLIAKTGYYANNIDVNLVRDGLRQIGAIVPEQY